MKTVFLPRQIPGFLSFLCIATLTFTSCNEKGAFIPSNNQITSIETLRSLVNNFNNELHQNFGVATPTIKKGVLAQGLLKSASILDKHGNPAFVFILETLNEEGITKEIKFDFGLDKAMDLELPEIIENAQIAFLGNQLIIQDLNNKNEQNLFVQYENDVVNKTPLIQTISGAYLGVQTSGNSLGLLSEGCDCDCEPCSGDGCRSLSCSCTTKDDCGGGGCSITCRSGNNAVCEDNCNGGGAQQ